MKPSEHARSIEAAQERLRRVRTEAVKALGPQGVAPPPGGDLLAVPAGAPPQRIVLLALAAAAAIPVTVLAGALGGAAFFVAAALVALLLGETPARRAARIRGAIDEEVDGILGRLEVYVTAQAARARDEAGTLDAAALQHAVREGTILTHLAPVVVTCPACGMTARGSEFARRKGCPRCRSGDALDRPREAADAAGAAALAEYALWSREATALARAVENARSVADLARRAEREVREGRQTARGTR
ncbi:MAG TPA: hypothetical protein VLS93_13780 [Anaeromyxobacteraceae bacterium]|nr:hypothetical protein [Anaeromyxobacteraceae bacterium]